MIPLGFSLQDSLAFDGQRAGGDGDDLKDHGESFNTEDLTLSAAGDKLSMN